MVIAVASAALVVSTPARSVALALGSVGPVILRCPEVEELAAQHADFDARRLAPDVVDRCRELAMQAARPIDDHRSSAAYRRHAIGVLTGRLLRRAFPHD
jgi:CO/xanthine dehydrogenase FAD-binding subunit